MDDIIKITPDRERVKSILEMVNIRENRIEDTDKSKYVSLLVEDYYEVIKELTIALMNLEGYKTLSHKQLYSWLEKNYSDFSEHQIQIINDLRITRNSVVYEGFSVKEHYLDKKLEIITLIISKLKKVIDSRLTK